VQEDKHAERPPTRPAPTHQRGSHRYVSAAAAARDNVSVMCMPPPHRSLSTRTLGAGTVDSSQTRRRYTPPYTVLRTPGIHRAVRQRNNADRRLRPRCCHLGSYFKRPKSSPVRPLSCNWYYCAQFIAKPKAACALRFSWAATSSNLGL